MRIFNMPLHILLDHLNFVLRDFFVYRLCIGCLESKRKISFKEKDILRSQRCLSLFSLFLTSRKLQQLLLASLFAISLSVSAQYSVVPIGSLGGIDTEPWRINAVGQVAGFDNVGGYWHAFLYSKGRLIDLHRPDSYESLAWGINDRGVVVGELHTPSGMRAFKYESGVTNDLGILDGSAQAINNQGYITGYSRVTNSNRAFLYRDGVLTDIGTLGGAQSVAYDINESSQIVGTSELSTTPVTGHAFLYSQGGMIDLGSFSPKAVNNLGQVVGDGFVTDSSGGNATRAFLYSNGRLTELCALLGISRAPSSFDFAHDINDLGQAVLSCGRTQINGKSQGYLYSNGTLRSLNSLIDPGLGWVITSAVSINNAGQIAVVAERPGARPAFGLILNPPGYNEKELGDPECENSAGTNPINIGTGNKYQAQTDYLGALPFLTITRHYNSRGNPDALFGSNWGMYGAISVLSDVSVRVIRPDRKVIIYNLVGGVWTPDKDITHKLAKTATGWQITTASNAVESYDASGRLLSAVGLDGLVQKLTYSDATTPVTIAPKAGLLIRVADTYERQLNFTYDSSSRIVKITDPAGGMIIYGYDADSNLASVTYPDGKIKTYLYGEAAYTSGASLPNALTGIIDENGVRFATYRYDAKGRAYDEDHGPNLPGGPVNHYGLVYNTDTLGNPTSTIVTDPLGSARTYNFTTILGVVKSTGSTQPGGSGCAAAASAVTYDPNGNVATRTDFNANRTTYTYDLTRNLETSRTEAVGTPVARTITTTWHPTYRLPTSITEPGRVTTNIYDDTSGNLLSRSITDTASSKTRTWTYTYTTSADSTLANLLKSVDGPRTDVTDLTSYTYYPNGDLQSVRNALNHETRITQYDPHGRPQTIIDPNSIVTSLTYWPRGWLKTRAVAGETSYYDYDGVGQITKVTSPDGSFISYTYDDAHRLTDIYDAQGNRIHYTLDNIGNRTKEEVFNNLGALVTTKSRVFDALNRLWKDIGALNQTTTFEYDANGNLKKIDGPLTTQNDVTVNNYDALNRLASSTDGLSGITRYGYDALDQLRSVTDPRNLITSYAVNALGEQSQLVSPDTGTANSNYDAAGNLSSRTDADGKVVSYSYDALNRVTSIQHNSTPKYTYTYDQGPNAIGKLSSISGGGSTTTWSYNAQGRMQSKVQQSGAVSLTTSYAYNASGQLSSMTYPSGKIVAYGYNSLGQIASISVNGQPVINNASYQAFGPVARWNWGNNSPYVRSFDTDGRLSSYPLGNFNTRSLGFDDASRIQNQTETTPFANTLFNYDELDRLKSWLPPNGNQSYDYDANGNRTRLVIGANSYTNTLSTSSNRLQSVAGPSAKTYSYNLSGNRINDGTNSFSYDSAQRLTNVTFPGGNSAYSINALGQRTLKSGTGVSTTHFTYDEMGKLMGEYDATGQPIEETLYLGDLPVAVLR